MGLGALLSDGLYLFYWFYLSWKHLKEETGRGGSPFWHAFGAGLPVLNLYITYVHLKAIRELAAASGVETGLGPLRGVVLVGLGNLAWLQGTLLSTGSLGRAVVLDLVGVVLFAYLMVWGQSTLNRCWAQKYGERLREAPVGRGEVLTVLLGLWSWALYLLMWRGILPTA